MTHRSLRGAACVALAALLLPTSRLAAQEQAQGFQNLQVLPRDIPRAQLIGIMRDFTQALGVRCDYCHAQWEGTPPPAQQGGGPNLNFASDSKVNKQKARFMMRMTDSLNRVTLASLPDRDPSVQVTCITCHRMSSVPTTIERVLADEIARAGVDSAIARYRMLRRDMARGRFDFTERPVSELARDLAAEGKHADAIRLLEMLQEFYPNSANIDFEIAELHLAAGNRDAGIARLRAILEKNPNNRRAAGRLRQLGVDP